MASPVSPVVAASAPAAPSAPAPAAPASSAPATPAAPVTQANQTASESASQQVSQQPTTAGAQPGATPAAQPAAQVAAEPKASDFAATEDGVVEFLQAHEKWAEENPDAATAAEAERRGEAPAEKPAAEPEAAKPAEEQKPGEEKPAEAKPAVEALPKAFEEAIEKNPALKAALASDPAAQKLVMDAARMSEAAKPILSLIPTAEAAQFVTGQANVVLDIKHNMLMGVDNPEAAQAGWNGLLQQFVETDDKGAPLKDAVGNPVYGKDLHAGILTPATNMVLGELQTKIADQIKTLEQKTKGYYPTEADKNADLASLEDAQYTRDALNYVLSLVSGEPETKTLPQLPPDATPEQKAFQERLQRQQEELAKKEQAAGAGKARQEVATYENKMRLNWQQEVGKSIDAAIAEAKGRNEYIPDYVLNRPWIDPATKQQTTFPALAVEILNEFDSKIMSIPTERDEIYRLQRLGPQGEQQRQQNAGRLRNAYLGDIVRKHIQEIQDGLRQSQQAEAARQGKIAEVVRQEPQTAGTGSAPVLTDAQVEQQAIAAAQKDPKWASGDREERFAILARERTRTKYGY